MAIASVSASLHTTGPWQPPRAISQSGEVAGQVRQGAVGGPREVSRSPDAASRPESGRTQAEQQALQALRQRDREVRAHEMAHLAAAGQYARGGASFEYQRGPDGRQYAVGGEVSIDTSKVPGDPEATLEKAETVRRAAMAPAQPSGQDRQVAAQAAAMAAEARTEIARARADGENGRAAASYMDMGSERRTSFNSWA